MAVENLEWCTIAPMDPRVKKWLTKREEILVNLKMQKDSLTSCWNLLINPADGIQMWMWVLLLLLLTRSYPDILP